MNKTYSILATLFFIFTYYYSQPTVAQTITDVSKISPSIYERKVLYDCNGDGKLEYLSQPTSSSNWRWNDKDGKIVKEIPNTSAYVLNENDILLVDDLNNDEIPDVLLKGRVLALSTGDEYTFIDNLTKGSAADGHALYNIFAMDINHDGRKDIVGFFSGKDAQGYTITYTPITLLQQPDGKFLYAPFKLSESTSNGSESTSYFTELINTPTVGEASSFGNGMFIGIGGEETSLITDYMASAQSVQFVDVNNDGFLDIIDTQKGFSMLSFSNGNYYPASFTGLLDVMDLNEDGVLDIVTFDNKQNQVLVDMSQSDGSYQETKLLENGNISAVYCRDLDADGLPDILALVPTSSTSFLVFFKNQGNGSFKKHERSLPYKGYYYFSEPYDLKNTGTPVLLFTNTVGDSNQIGIVSWDKDFNVKEEACMSGTTQLYIGINKTTNRPAFSECVDYDGDSRLDIPSILYNRSACLVSVATHNNTAPSKVGKPFCILDKATGKLRINWDAATDNEQSSCDLIYEVRVGTSPTASNVALHNVEKSQWCVINMGQQQVGNYYVSVRAIDPNGMKGVWSDCTVVNHTNPIADFIISKKVMGSDNAYEYEKIGYKKDYYTTDVIVATSLYGSNVTFTASPDGTILSTNNGVAQITFNDMGTKTISMTASNGAIVQKQIEVKPFKVQELKNAGDKDAIRSYADLNANGKSELFYGNIKQWVNNQYESIETLFNSDLNLGKPAFLTDKTRNGYPDICKDVWKNGIEYNWLLNNGDLDFEVSDEEIKDTQGNVINRNSISQAIDINNDGMVDYFYGGTLYINQGNGIYEKKSYKLGGEILLTDYDQDGLLDMLEIRTVTFKQYTPVEPVGLEERFCNVYHNDGDGNFSLVTKDLILTKINTSVTSTDHYSHHFLLQDVNGDGLDDIVTYVTYWTGHVKVRTMTHEVVGNVKAFLGSKEDPYKDEMILPGIPLNHDLNNDNKTDFYTYKASNAGHYADSLLISQGDQYVKVPTDVLFYARNEVISIQDVNNDNRPDFITSSRDVYPYSLLSNYTNTAPTKPTNVVVSQTNKEIIVNWDAATDAETSSSQLRYNLSVKEKGAEGNGAYIISPMNATKDEAKVMDYGIKHLRSATRYPIPINSFEAGKTYEFCVQAVDPWMMHSPFSQKVEFTVSKTNLISLPEMGGVGTPIVYKLNNVEGKTPTVTAPGAIMTDGTLRWNTPGIKTVTAKVGTVSTTQQIKILDKPDLNVSIPEKVMAGAKVTVKLPEEFRINADKVKLSSNENKKIILQGDSIAIITMPTIAGIYPVAVEYQDTIFGLVKETKNISVIDARPSIVSIGNDNGKNKLKWDTSVLDASFVNKVRIYRETNLEDSYEMIAEVTANGGQYTDASSHPDVQSYNYRMSYLTKDGIEGLPSPIHNTVFLMANKGAGYDINLHWTPYEGAEVEKYTILMGTSAENLAPIATVTGERKSYLVNRTNNSKVFFALQYTLASNESSSYSNTISSNDADEVIKAQSLNIRCAEDEVVLNEDQMKVHLQAVVTPMSAHLADVAWRISSGEELATIDAHGVLSLKENENGGVVTVEASTIDGSNIKTTFEVDAAAYQWIPSVFADADVRVTAIQLGENKKLLIKDMPMLDMRNVANTFVVHSFNAHTTGPVKDIRIKYRVYEVGKPMNSWNELGLVENGIGDWVSTSVDFHDAMLRMTEGQDQVLEFYYVGTSKTGDTFFYNNGGENYHFMFNCVKPKPENMVKNTTAVFGYSHVTFLINGNERSFDYEEDGNPNEIVDLGAIQSFVLDSYWNAWNSTGSNNLRYKIEEEGSGGKWRTIASENNSRFVRIGDEDYLKSYKENIGLDLLEGLETGKKYRLEISGESSVYNEYYYNDYYEYTSSRSNVKYCPFYTWKNGESSVFTFTIKDSSAITPGDANGDGGVNVFDVTTTVNHILGSENEGFDEDAADVNGDGTVNVFDVTKMVNIILGVDDAGAKMRKVEGLSGTDKLYLEDFEIEPGEEKEVNILLDNPNAEYRDLQFDLYLPEGISVVQDEDEEFLVDTGSRCTKKHTIGFSYTDGHYVCMLYSTAKNPLTGNSGDILTITLKADEGVTSGVKTGSFLNVSLSKTDATGPTYDEFTFGITVKGDANAISDINADDATYQIITPDGKQVDALQQGVNIIRYPNGAAKKVFVK
ncbi:MAG: VCBS repeat-containing protein [Bacteroidaceae bacterium]|nr:VCBS repeat-containing protein [Bacteroidaceae bacterium]